MRKLTLTLSAAVLALGAGSIAYAQNADRPGAMRGQDMTRAQAEEMATKAFERADANGDGQINEADRDARQDARFARLDTNGDGVLSKEEFLAPQKRRAENRATRGDRDGQRMGRMGRRGMRGAGMDRGMAANADTNGDGTISQSEFTAAALTRFDEADADNDGTVTREERRAARQAMRNSMRERMRGQRQNDNS